MNLIKRVYRRLVRKKIESDSRRAPNHSHPTLPPRGLVPPQPMASNHAASFAILGLRQSNIANAALLFRIGVTLPPGYEEVGGLVMKATTSSMESVRVSKWLNFFS